MRLIKQGIVCMLLGALPMWAMAGDQTGQTGAISESSFGTLDMDKSGTLSRDELKAYPALTKNFDIADHNTDGKLSPAEFTALVAESKTGAE